MATRAGIFAHAVAVTARISAPTVVEAIRGVPADHELFDRRLDGWAKDLVEAAHVRVQVEGVERVPAGEVVVMSNHASLYDIPILFRAIPKRLRMVAKTELFRVPIWGQAMRIAGFVELDRSDRKRAMEALHASRERIHKDGISLWIAPEGTRSRTGVMGKFKQGGFHLAIDAGLPILPVSLVGTNAVLSKGTTEINTGVTVRVVIHDPVDAEGYGHERRKELLTSVRATIASSLPPELRGDEKNGKRAKE